MILERGPVVMFGSYIEDSNRARTSVLSARVPEWHSFGTDTVGCCQIVHGFWRVTLIEIAYLFRFRLVYTERVGSSNLSPPTTTHQCLLNVAGSLGGHAYLSDITYRLMIKTTMMAA